MRVSERPAVSFAELDERIRRGVEQVSGADTEAPDPFRGMYVTDEQAVALASGGAPARPSGADTDAPDPLGGMYVPDEQAVALASGGPPPLVEDRLDELAALL